MNVRLTGVPLTVEDFAIWLSLAARHEHLLHPYIRVLEWDRRDSDIMYAAQLLASLGLLWHYEVWPDKDGWPRNAEFTRPHGGYLVRGRAQL